MLNLTDILPCDEDDSASSTSREHALAALHDIELSEELACAIKANDHIAVDAANAAFRLGMFDVCSPYFRVEGR